MSGEMPRVKEPHEKKDPFNLDAMRSSFREIEEKAGDGKGKSLPGTDAVRSSFEDVETADNGKGKSPSSTDAVRSSSEDVNMADAEAGQGFEAPSFEHGQPGSPKPKKHLEIEVDHQSSLEDETYFSEGEKSLPARHGKGDSSEKGDAASALNDLVNFYTKHNDDSKKRSVEQARAILEEGGGPQAAINVLQRLGSLRHISEMGKDEEKLIADGMRSLKKFRKSKLVSKKGRTRKRNEAKGKEHGDTGDQTRPAPSLELQPAPSLEFQLALPSELLRPPRRNLDPFARIRAQDSRSLSETVHPSMRPERTTQAGEDLPSIKVSSPPPDEGGGEGGDTMEIDG